MVKHGPADKCHAGGRWVYALLGIADGFALLLQAPCAAGSALCLLEASGVPVLPTCSLSTVFSRAAGLVAMPRVFALMGVVAGSISLAVAALLSFLTTHLLLSSGASSAAGGRCVCCAEFAWGRGCLSLCSTQRAAAGQCPTRQPTCPNVFMCSLPPCRRPAAALLC